MLEDIKEFDYKNLISFLKSEKMKPYIEVDESEGYTTYHAIEKDGRIAHIQGRRVHIYYLAMVSIAYAYVSIMHYKLEIISDLLVTVNSLRLEKFGIF